MSVPKNGKFFHLIFKKFPNYKLCFAYFRHFILNCSIRLNISCIFFGRKDEEKKEFSMKKKHSSERSKDNEQMVCSSYKKYYSAQKDQITSAN
jgi:hypothetical protein